MDKEKLHALSDSLNQYKRSTYRSKVPTLGDHLNTAKGGLANLVDNINRINCLSQIFNDVLEPPLIDHCQIVHLRNNILVLAVDSSQWANRLRFEKLSILTKLRQNGLPSISSIDIIVQPGDFNR